MRDCWIVLALYAGIKGAGIGKCRHEMEERFFGRGSVRLAIR